MLATSTDLPRIRAAMVTEAEVGSVMLVPFVVRARMIATMWRMTKKKIVGGNISINSCLIVVVSLLMFLSWPDRVGQHHRSAYDTKGVRGLTVSSQLDSIVWSIPVRFEIC